MIIIWWGIIIPQSFQRYGANVLWRYLFVWGISLCLQQVFMSHNYEALWWSSCILISIKSLNCFIFSRWIREVILNALIACKMKERAILLLIQCISNDNNGPQSWGIIAAILDFREYKLNEGLYLAKLDQRCYNEHVFIQKYAWIIPFYSKCKTKIQKYCQIDFWFFQTLTLISF